MLRWLGGYGFLQLLFWHYCGNRGKTWNLNYHRPRTGYICKRVTATSVCMMSVYWFENRRSVLETVALSGWSDCCSQHFRVTRCNVRVKYSLKFLANGSWVRRIDALLFIFPRRGKVVPAECIVGNVSSRVSKRKVNWLTQDPLVHMRMDSLDTHTLSPRQVRLFAKWTVVY